MGKKKIKKIISVVISVSLLFGGVMPFQVSANEMTKTMQDMSANKMTETTQEVVEMTGSIKPDEIEVITEEEARELNEIFENRNEEKNCSIPKINTQYTSSYGYNSLETEAQKECYALLKEKAFVFQEEFLEPVVRKQGTADEYYIWEAFDFGSFDFDEVTFRKVLFAVEADYPELFWYTGNFSYSKNSQGNVGCVYPKIEVDYIEVNARKEAQESIDLGIVPYIEAINEAKEKDATDLELEFLIHDMIIDAVDYAYVGNTTTPEDAGYAHSIVGVFGKKGVVCEGYAKTFQLLANYAGLSSIYAVGYGYNQGHAWNLVCLDDEWYNLDITWNDVGTNGYYDGIQYSYFNCSSDDFINHRYVSSVFPGMYEVPETTATKYNYYEYYDLAVTEENVESLEVFLKNALKRSSERKDYLLQFSFEDSSIRNEFATLLSENGKSILKEISDEEIWYIDVGGYSYTNTKPYCVFFPVICVYADNYQVEYGTEQHQLQFHMIERRKEILEDENYRILYQDNEDVGMASAEVVGVGAYENIGSHTFEFEVVSSGGVIVTPSTPTCTSTPTSTAIPTDTSTPTNTITPTDTVIPTGTIIPTDTSTPTGTVIPTSTTIPICTVIPTGTPTPMATTTPTGIITPTVTAIPSSTTVPTDIVTPSAVATLPANTVTPSVTITPSATLPADTVIPSVTATLSPTKTTTPTAIVTQPPTNTVTPTAIVTQPPTNTTIPTSTIMPTNTVFPTRVITPTVVPTSTVVPTTTVTPKVKIPGKVTLKIQTRLANSIKLSWKKVPYAKGYVIYRSTKKNGTYKVCKKITSPDKLTFEDKKLKNQTTYYYYVKAYNKDGNVQVYGTPSKKVSKKVIGTLKTPKNLKLKKGSYNTNKNTIILSWSKVNGAEKIEIYAQKMTRKKNSSGNYVYVVAKGSKKKKITSVSGKKTSAKISCKNNDLKTEFYKYTIKAYYKTDANKKITSKESKGVVIGGFNEQ